MKSQKDKAIAFRQLHHSGRVLVLPNAWDVVSARVFEDAGFSAIGTSSGGVAASLGYPDGEKMDRGEMLEVVRRIATAVAIPVTADMEAGYVDAPGGIAETTKGTIAAGAVGLNIEDVDERVGKKLLDTQTQVERIRSMRRTADSLGFPLVINARTDAFRLAPGESGDRLREAVARGNAYAQAGADCVFLFWMRDPPSIAQAVRDIRCPVNIVAGGNAPPISELERLGVARVSFGTGPVCATVGLLKRMAAELKERGTYENITTGAVTYTELNKLAAPAQETVSP